MFLHRTTVVSAMVMVLACSGQDASEEVGWIPTTPYDRYVHSIIQAGLDESAVARDWIEAGTRALDQALPVFAPYSQVGYFDPAQTRAVSYRLEARRGQRLIVEFKMSDDDSARVFMDLFRAPRSASTPPVHVASSDSVSGSIEFVAYWDGAYILRLQPELLRGGRYELTVRNAASLAFPVAAHDTRNIQSVFGDPRDGGSRNHQGVDIFSRRNTPVIATTKGTVTWVGTNRLGGNVIWVRDARRGQSFYYAHLEKQIAQRGQRVQPGDTLGLVGNSGNARTTPTHLHFGVYVRGRGAVDPYPFLYQPTGLPAVLVADTGQLGEWVRVATTTLSVYRSPSSRSTATTGLERNTPLRVVAGTGAWFEIELPDGGIGFVRSRATASLEGPIDTRLLADGGLVLNAPASDAVVTDSIEPGTTVPVLGRFAGYLLVELRQGRSGWIDQNDVATSVASAANQANGT